MIRLMFAGLNPSLPFLMVSEKRGSALISMQQIYPSFVYSTLRTHLNLIIHLQWTASQHRRLPALGAVVTITTAEPPPPKLALAP